MPTAGSDCPMNDDVGVQNAIQSFLQKGLRHGGGGAFQQACASDQALSIVCEQPLTFTPSVFLLSKLLAAAERERKRHDFSVRGGGFSESPGPRLPLNMQASTSVGRAYLQTPEPTAKSVTQRSRMASVFCRTG